MKIIDWDQIENPVFIDEETGDEIELDKCIHCGHFQIDCVRCLGCNMCGYFNNGFNFYTPRNTKEEEKFKKTWRETLERINAQKKNYIWKANI